MLDTNKPHILKRWFFWLWVIFLVGFVLLTLSVNFDQDSVAAWFDKIANEPWAIPATILIYLVSAFASAPQWMLHGGTILAFGTIQGAGIAWGATMISASFDFWLGRRLGADRVQSFGGTITASFIDVVRRYGFWASMIVRIVPTGPFVMVNLAAGISGMRFLVFFLGTAIGILPKIIAITMFGEGVKGAVNQKGPIFVAIIVGIAFVWMGLIYLLGKRLSVENSPNSDI